METKRRNGRRYGAMLLGMLAVLLMLSTTAFASEKSDGARMKKVLKYFKAGNYELAEQYGSSLPKYASEKCVKNMPAKMKKAYRKVLKSYKPKVAYTIGESKFYNSVMAYYLTDVDNDGKAELMITYGSGVNANFYIYRYTSGKAVKVYDGYISSNRTLHAYPKHKGFIYHDAIQGGENLVVETLKGSSLKSKDYGHRMAYPYLTLGLELDGHSSYSTAKHRYVLDYSPLK
ncbi:MAG: hypothetical protein Q4B01_02305 [Eubacteriales bacterium]|nr:hypothetical protein [Eubacteriales bacterium]